jgi:hypothetical protein
MRAASARSGVRPGVAAGTAVAAEGGGGVAVCASATPPSINSVMTMIGRSNTWNETPTAVVNSSRACRLRRSMRDGRFVAAGRYRPAWLNGLGDRGRRGTDGYTLRPSRGNACVIIAWRNVVAARGKGAARPETGAQTLFILEG